MLLLGVPPPCKNQEVKTEYADVAELADALDLGSSDFIVGVQVPSPAPPLRMPNKDECS